MLKKVLLSFLSLVVIVGCSGATVKGDEEKATYIESVDEYNTFTALKVVDKETGCKYLIINTPHNNSNYPMGMQMYGADGLPVCK
ncbi:hypothetical protein M5X02_32285 [Paenibacillus alvei]|uniref:hypothetical protein n=1 Tax=Paenibacillus alvei TaxID=44250 RepID=UPI0002898964|nr:hypothetical protein [Paenibacillus alvei]EJW13963.1 hypothetical protein PAV_141p00690 [Paenibacillus alvei DSM 29]MCY9545308.1 hypothetical protein [Paenibacillus alvei]MCY9707675.1 hypothetical protein [Paenibacillus alvei]MEC0082813.1 hypothetical protein [Paenibacillus alvei]